MSRKKTIKKVDPLTGKPSADDNAIKYSAFRMGRRVDPLTGEDSTRNNAITYSVYKTRVYRKQKRKNKRLDQGKKRAKLSLVIYNSVTNDDIERGDYIKAEVADHKLGF
jgi:hypothetical protein